MRFSKHAKTFTRLIDFHQNVTWDGTAQKSNEWTRAFDDNSQASTSFILPCTSPTRSRRLLQRDHEKTTKTSYRRQRDSIGIFLGKQIRQVARSLLLLYALYMHGAAWWEGEHTVLLPTPHTHKNRMHWNWNGKVMLRCGFKLLAAADADAAGWFAIFEWGDDAKLLEQSQWKEWRNAIRSFTADKDSRTGWLVGWFSWCVNFLWKHWALNVVSHFRFLSNIKYSIWAS